MPKPLLLNNLQPPPILLLLLLLLLLTAFTSPSLAVVNSAGCGKHHDFIGSSRNFTIQSDDRKRSYLVHLPKAYRPDVTTPLLLAFHGASNNPSKFERQTRFSDERVNWHMIVVYPAGFHEHWEGPSYATPGIDDKAFISRLIEHLLDHYCIDRSRIYGTGHSNGAGFLADYACSRRHGNHLAAIAPVSGAFYADARPGANARCRPDHLPLPVMEVHGTADESAPYDGGDGRGGPLPSIPEWVGRWAKRDGCYGQSVDHVLSGGRVHDLRWEPCAGRHKGVLRHVRIDGWPHKWPGPDSPFDASAAVVEFLTSHYGEARD
ncbi:hypothetical protein L249_5307 [Ophiocordyceps polyrhachis-furcata BCC 54312]|uniref:feruloyl esterase n=1 Tax=Ophiocordyceps polyrhachis-furcata BCC 54312 TaxID=1330021 RepID=A0A367L8G6_9HYPO|nr:hypothetical protein L249_5307 [Ophiocordyceps polyrhachis-furcata BCC 54312]